MAFASPEQQAAARGMKNYTHNKSAKPGKIQRHATNLARRHFFQRLELREHLYSTSFTLQHLQELLRQLSSLFGMGEIACAGYGGGASSGFDTPNSGTDPPMGPNISSMKTRLKRMIAGALVAGAIILPTYQATATIAPIIVTTITTNELEQIKYEWGVRNKDPPANIWAEDAINKYIISVNLPSEGMYNFENTGSNWVAQTDFENENFYWEASLPGNFTIKPAYLKTFSATIDLDKVAGNQQVQSYTVALNGYVSSFTTNTLITVPITYSTTTSNGTTVGTIIDAGFNASNTMEYFEASSVTNSDSDTMTDVQEFIAGTDPTVPDSLNAMIQTTTNGIELATAPSLTNRIYKIYASTNLTEGAGFELHGSYTGNVGMVIDTAGRDSASFKIEVSLP